MWNKVKTSPISCTECRVRLPAHAEACPECGYPVTGRAHHELFDAAEVDHATLKEYKLIQLLGAIVIAAGIIAAIADSPIAAAVSITIGGGTYLTGLLGSWWNRA